MILDIIHMHKVENQCHIRLACLGATSGSALKKTRISMGKARIGERITNLYLDGLIQNKDGYALTKKGREQLRSLLGSRRLSGLGLTNLHQKGDPIDAFFDAVGGRNRSSRISRPGNFPSVGQLALVPHSDHGAAVAEP